MRRSYHGSAIEVTFDLDRCIHVAECLRGLPEVFDRERRPWILPDAGDPDVVAEIVERCPSGALQYRRLDDRPDEAHAATIVTPIRNGPLRVTGPVTVRLEDGTEEVLPRATLCRCGNSGRKPFCDNSHLAAGFRAPGRPFGLHGATRPEDVAAPGEPAGGD